MNQEVTAHEELMRLVSALLEGRIKPAQLAELESLLKRDVSARRLYMQMVDQEIELPHLIASTQSRASSQNEMIGERTSFGAFTTARVWWRWIVGGATALALMLLLFAILSSADWFGKSTEKKRVRSVDPVGDSWQCDFENGSLLGWYGRMVRTNLPAGSRFGIAAIVKHYRDDDFVYAIELPQDWSWGLVKLTPGSTLHVTYRLERQTHVNIFAHTIPAAGSLLSDYQMYQLRTGGGFPGAAGVWQTASIPFANFLRKTEVSPGGLLAFVGSPPQNGEFVTTLSFASVEPADLVIDRVWITPTGSGREEVVPLKTQAP